MSDPSGDQQGGPTGDRSVSDLGREMSLVDGLVYRICWSALWLLCKIWFRFYVVGKENLPSEEPYILAPVHRSYLDTPVGLSLIHI